MNENSERTYDCCSSCTLYLGAIIITLLCQAVAGVAATALNGVVPDIAKNGDFNAAFMIVIQIAVFAFVLLYGKRTKRAFNFVALNEGQNGKPHFTAFVVPVAAAAVLMCGMFLPTVWYGYFTQYALGIPPETGQINVQTPSAVVMLVIASVFFAPVCEETVYRGVLFNGLKSEYSPLKAVMLSALSFMLMHMSPMQVVFQFSLGVLSAFIMYESGRLISCVLLHASANALALVIELTPFGAALNGCVEWMTHNVAAATFITLGLIIAAGGILFVLVKYCFKNKAELCAESDRSESEKVKDEMLSAMRKKDGFVRYCIAVAICGVMFVLNAVTGMLS